MVETGEPAMAGLPEFFTYRQAQSLFKHDLLIGHAPRFVGKTGSASRDGVALLDGYAGTGMYGDGSPGSPILMARTAFGMRDRHKVRCLYVEAKKSCYDQLRSNLATIDHAWAAWHGRLEDNLDDVLRSAGVLPLFAFLDPFGAGLPLDLLGHFLVRPRTVNGQRLAKTELLLNFSHKTIDRMAGKLDAVGQTPAQSKSMRNTIERLNSIMGGSAWQDMWRAALPGDRDEMMRLEYAKTLAKTAEGWDVWPIAVPKAYGQRPVYYMFFLTQSPHGLWAFNETVSLAVEKLVNRTHAALSPRDQMTLDLTVPPPREKWERMIRNNVQSLMADRGVFDIAEEIGGVLDGVLGVARETHVRQALKGLWAEGRIIDRPKGDLIRYRVRPQRSGDPSNPGPPRQASRHKSARQGVVHPTLAFDLPTA